MNLDIVQQLVQILREAPEVGAIEIRRRLFGAWSSIRVSKAGHATTNAGGGSHVVVTRPSDAPTAGLAAPAAVAAAAPSPGSAASALVEIKSPMVGTFYSAPEPGTPPYLKVGNRIAPGQVVCIIEAMKIMNEIESELAGVVREIAVENAQPVEFGQVLFRVDPHG